MTPKAALIVKSTVFVFWLASFVDVGLAAEAPVIGAPGTPTGALVAVACPTFHWGSTSVAEAYEIVVYRLTTDEREAEPVLRRRVPAPIDGWTPPLGDCLERGGSYAWAVRAIGPEGESAWSAPSLFRVARAPSDAELEWALEIVRTSLGERGSTRELDEPTDALAEEPTKATLATPRARPLPGPGAPLAAGSHSGAGGGIVVDGATVETKADPPCFPSEGDPDAADRFIDCGNGTVHDTITGLLWLKDASCTAEMKWFQANAFAAALADGQCGLTDHSQAGDWRLPTRSEWESIFRSCAEPPGIAGRDNDCYADDPSNEWATGVVAESQQPYWSATSDDPPSYAWTAYLSGGSFSSDLKANFLYWVWPVRDRR